MIFKNDLATEKSLIRLSGESSWHLFGKCIKSIFVSVLQHTHCIYSKWSFFQLKSNFKLNVEWSRKKTKTFNLMKVSFASFRIDWNSFYERRFSVVPILTEFGINYLLIKLELLLVLFFLQSANKIFYRVANSNFNTVWKFDDRKTPHPLTVCLVVLVSIHDRIKFMLQFKFIESLRFIWSTLCHWDVLIFYYNRHWQASE